MTKIQGKINMQRTLFILSMVVCCCLQAGTEMSLRISQTGTSGETSECFMVLDVPGKMPGAFTRPEQKFVQNAGKWRMATMGDKLQIFVTCSHPADMQTKDGEYPWSGDCAEIFLQPSPASPIYYQYAINAAGDFAAFKYNAPHAPVDGWKTKAGAVVSKTNDFFLITLTIPKSELEGADWTSGAEMRGNVIRSGETAGGISCWSKIDRSNFHLPDTFGTIIVNSRRDYFQRRLAPIIKILKEKPSELLQKKCDYILEHADDPKAWKDLNGNLGELELALLQGETGKLLIWDAPVWSNNLTPTPASKPLKELKLTAACNSRVICGFAVSNLSDQLFMGQLKFLSYDSLKYIKEFYVQPWDELREIACRIRLSEAIPIHNLQNLPNYDPLVPLPLQTLIRCNPFTTVPLFLSIDIHGLAAGTYKGLFYLKPSYQGFERAQIPFELEVLDVNLDEVQLDNFIWDDMMHSKSYHMGLNRAKFMVDYEFNCLLVNSIGFQLEFTPEITENGDIVKLDFTDLDNIIDLYIKAGMPQERIKLLFQFGQADRGFILAGTTKRVPKYSQAWNKAAQEWVRRLAKHLNEKYSISYDRWWFYPWDEPNGSFALDDPESTVVKAIFFAKLFKEADPNCRLWANPYDWKTNEAAYATLNELAKYFDTLSPNRSNLRNEEIIKAARDTGRELWTYSVLSNTTSPIYYRTVNWLNQRDGFTGPASFWCLDIHSGGDGFDPTDVTSGNNRVDYGTAYVDKASDEALTSRRLEAYFMGHLDRKAMKLCQKVLQEKQNAGIDVSAETKEYNEIIHNGCNAKSVPEFQKLHTDLLRLIAKLRKL